jgi:REP element-mobilizing transposase RayT
MPHVAREPVHHGVFHVTARLRSDLPSLRRARVVAAIERTFRRGCAREDCRMVHYWLERDHVRLVVEAADVRALRRRVRALLIRVARAANAIWRRRGAVFADRYHLHLLRTPREV